MQDFFVLISPIDTFKDAFLLFVLEGLAQCITFTVIHKS